MRIRLAKGKSRRNQSWFPKVVLVAAFGIGAYAAPRTNGDMASRGKQTRSIRSEADRLVTGSPEQLQSVVAGTPPTAVLKVVPVPAKVGAYPAGTSIVGNELITRGGGFRAWFEVQVSDWDPAGNGPNAVAYQVKIDCAGYYGAIAEPPNPGVDLVPAGWPSLEVPGGLDCSAGVAVCRNAFGEQFAKCGGEGGSPGFCDAGYLDGGAGAGRADSWCRTPEGCTQSGVYQVTCNFIFFAVSQDPSMGPGIVDGHIVYHGGTLVLDIPPGALGTYTVNLNTEETFMAEPGAPPIIITTLVESGFKVTILPVFYVNHLATGLNDGSSWVNAFTDLKDALAAANSGDEIWVARGTYKPATCGSPCNGSSPERSTTFQLESGVALYGGFFGGENSRDTRDPEHNVTILSGDLNDDDGPGPFEDYAENSYHIVTASSVDSTTTLDGFTLSGGNASGSLTLGNGAALEITGAPRIRNCLLKANSALQTGAGIHFDSGDPAIIGCTFVDNRAANGAAIYFDDSGQAPEIQNCHFYRNTATASGGAIYSSGNASTAIIVGCLFSENTANDGGAIACKFGSTPQFNSCTFSRNSATANGGGIYNGGGLGGSPFIVDSIFWDNRDNNELNADESAQIHIDSGSPTVNYCSVQGGWSGTGANNSSSDPLFVNSGANDFRLQSGSPAIDSGDNAAVPPGVTVDLNGNPRFIEDRLTPNTGNGTPPIVDRGAFEFVRDCNNNGVADDIELTATPDLDCDGNDNIDSCDIADCGGSAECDDCNLNGKPDLCDVPPSTGCPSGICVSGCSVDTNEDCVPDECVEPAASGSWAGVDWGLGPGVFPGAVNAPDDLSVTIPDNTTIDLGVTVEVASVDVKGEAALNVTGGNLTITGAEGQTAGPITPPPNKPKLRLDGIIVVANSNNVTVESGAVVVNKGGDYHGTGTTNSALTAVDIVVYAGGELSFEHAMLMTSSGTLTLDGRETDPFCHSPLVAGSVAGPITRPPKLLPRGDSGIIIHTLALVGSAEVIVESTVPVLLGSDFDNRSVVPHLFDWTVGKLTLDGALPQAFEVAGINMGQTMDGFSTNADALFDDCPPAQQHTNYSMGTVEVASTANVKFANRFPNTVAVGCAEALYVHNLVFQSGAMVTIDNCRIYYETFINQGAAITKRGCGDLLPVVPPNAIHWDPATNPIPWPNNNPLATTRSLRFTVDGPGGPSKPEAIKVTMVDLQHPRPANLLAQPPPNLTAYDTRPNGVCVGGALAGHHCDIDADCPSSTCGSPVACTADPTCTDANDCTLPSNTCTRWVGKPGTFLEFQDFPAGTTYKASRLQCTPYYHDWKPEGLITVVGAEILPSSEYSVQTYGASCMGVEANCAAVSSGVTMYTRRSGDTGPNFNPPATSTQPDALDIAAVVNKAKQSLSPLVQKSITQLQPNLLELNADVSALDISVVVDAVRQVRYAYSGPCPCPSTVTCGATACPAGDGVCVMTYGAGAMCVKTCAGGANAGDPCINNTHCPGSSCGTPLCRDRCGRCSPP